MSCSAGIEAGELIGDEETDLSAFSRGGTLGDCAVGDYGLSREDREDE